MKKIFLFPRRTPINGISKFTKIISNLRGNCKSRINAPQVIPAEAGIQKFQCVTSALDTGFHRCDEFCNWLLLIFFLLPVVFGCQATQGVYTSGLPGGQITLSRLAVLPFQDLAPADPAVRMVSCPLCGAIFQTEKLAPAAEKVVFDMVLTSLREYKHITVIEPDQTTEVYARTAASGPSLLPEILQKTGKELKVDAILVGYVFRYRERKGYSYSVEKPASAAFDLHLVRVRDGAIVWRGAFDKTQNSLAENVLQASSFFSRGGKWVTVQELAADGLTAVLKTFPGMN